MSIIIPFSVFVTTLTDAHDWFFTSTYYKIIVSQFMSSGHFEDYLGSLIGLFSVKNAIMVMITM